MRDIPWEEIINRIMLPACIATLKMLVLGALLGGFFGFILAMIMYMTREDGIRPNKTVNTISNALISVIRSFPFIILMVSIIPLTRLIVGTSIGWQAAIVPLTVAATPFMARIFENSLKEVNPSLVEAAKSFGASDMQIIFKVVIVEALPSLVSGYILSVIQVLNFTAVAGTIGAGGLGASALQYGYQSNNDKVMYSIVLVLVVWVILIQVIGDFVYKKIR
ncbi:ABC transporter permease [Clostridium autoethanogenum]|uniref:D-methionine transport system permease protein MetI n=2 Tax=Clostridium TaxID=1485 RepID=D8GNF9_CLOLD|nr:MULTISPECIES: methionine ABC transporter permease [Clostridium]ADK15822.1 predicted ABC-type metal ion transport system, permease component [Clostridium ljungdahlii DSM 13528]OAA84309.1 D-methionine transport system permease protein MetI [Clostridium ljungdahlii DSM 13528]RMC96037.1 ABC transporter permease [Clostridium autoethanogenum]